MRLGTPSLPKHSSPGECRVACHMLRLPRLAVASLLAVAARLERTWETARAPRHSGSVVEVVVVVVMWRLG